jgi:hypothetical protein
MSADLSAKVQATLWWITSIAASVLCCSVLFLFFANHIVGIREMVQDTNHRIGIIEAREDRILAELELIRKHAVFQRPVGATQAPGDAATEAPVSLSVSGTNPDKAEKAPEVAPAEVSTTPAPAAVPTPVPAQPAKK